MTRVTITVEGEASELAPVLLALVDPAHVAELIVRGVEGVLLARDGFGVSTVPVKRETPSPPIEELPAASVSAGSADAHGDGTAGASHPAGSGEVDIPTPPPRPAAAAPYKRVPWDGNKNKCRKCGHYFYSEAHKALCPPRSGPKGLPKAFQLKPTPTPPAVTAPPMAIPREETPAPIVEAEADADGHTHRWTLSAPNHEGIVHGKCWCTEERDFDPEAREFGREYKHTAAVQR